MLPSAAATALRAWAGGPGASLLAHRVAAASPQRCAVLATTWSSPSPALRHAAGARRSQATILDGKLVAKELRKEIRGVLKQAASKGLPPAGLAAVRVGEDPASEVYVNMKIKAAKQVHIESFEFILDESSSVAQVCEVIDALNVDQAVHGILLQLPLPAHLRDHEHELTNRIAQAKDVDGFTDVSAGRFFTGHPGFPAATPHGIMILLEHYYGKPEEFLKGKECVVVGASNIVGKPMAVSLLHAGGTVTVCHEHTKDLRAHVERAEVLVVAVGIPDLVPGSWIREGAVVVDVGINRLEGGKLVGDVEYEGAAARAASITPVPGGVGPMTVASLLRNTLEAYKIANQLED